MFGEATEWQLEFSPGGFGKVYFLIYVEENEVSEVELLHYLVLMIILWIFCFFLVLLL